MMRGSHGIPARVARLARKFVGANFFEAADTLLLEDEIVATDGDNEEIGIPIGFSRRDEILDVIVDIDWAQPDRREKSQSLREKNRSYHRVARHGRELLLYRKRCAGSWSKDRISLGLYEAARLRFGTRFFASLLLT